MHSALVCYRRDGFCIFHQILILFKMILTEFTKLLNSQSLDYDITSDGLLLTKKNQGSVDLSSLTTLPENVSFENQGSVYLRSLNGEYTYKGKIIKIANVDRYTMIMGSSKKAGDAVVYSARYFGGGEIGELKKCYIAKGGDYTAHGETAREALTDLRFKILQSSADIDEIITDVKRSGVVSVVQYRLITGACSEGVRRFIKEQGLPEGADVLPIKEVIELTRGHYGGSRIAELFS